MSNILILAFNLVETLEMFQINAANGIDGYSFRTHISDEVPFLTARPFTIMDGDKFVLVPNKHTIVECINSKGVTHSAAFFGMTSEGIGPVAQSIVGDDAMDVLKDLIGEVSLKIMPTGILPDPNDYGDAYYNSTLVLWNQLRANLASMENGQLGTKITEQTIGFTATPQVGFEEFAKKKRTELENIESFGVANPRPC